MNRIHIPGSWRFTGPEGTVTEVTLPHTWNNVDGQDGGNDYKRCTCTYEKTFDAPAFKAGEEVVYLRFEGVNASAKVFINGTEAFSHDGGYSTFNGDITALLKEGENLLTVQVNNEINDRVYPQKADFTFYGGIYRDLYFLVKNNCRFNLDYYGGDGLSASAAVKEGKGVLTLRSFLSEACSGKNVEVRYRLTDGEGSTAAEAAGTEAVITLDKPHLWDGRQDPYLYTVTAELLVNGEVTDSVSKRVGFRSFRIDPKEGFFLNGRSYPLRGVSRHQDRKGLGNAITRAEHLEDMDLICELGANTIRLAHYQHDQYFYDLCDERGMVVWAEIPYISEHMENGLENTVSQMKELITQNIHHASIVMWGVSNEITISTKNKAHMLENHHLLNDLCHEMDPSRLTTLACYAVCGPFNKSAHVTDVVAWNLYLGWYVPCMWLNDLWVGFFHLCFPKRPLGYSEYGAEGMPNLHSHKPKRNDHTEEYQAIYHEYLLRFFDRHPYMWGSYVWNMFDFAADARDQGGEPGMNHKGLMTFDRKTKKDSFYLYKCWWTKEPMVHIAGKRFEHRPEEKTTIKVYCNCPSVTLFVNGEKFASQQGDHVFTFKDVPLGPDTAITAKTSGAEDSAIFHKADTLPEQYILPKKKNPQKSNWV